jgi:hypothetical protein
MAETEFPIPQDHAGARCLVPRRDLERSMVSHRKLCPSPATGWASAGSRNQYMRRIRGRAKACRRTCPGPPQDCELESAKINATWSGNLG